MIKIVDELISPYIIQIDMDLVGLLFTVGIPSKGNQSLGFMDSATKFRSLEDSMKYIANRHIVANKSDILTLRKFIEFQKETNEMLLNTIKV